MGLWICMYTGRVCRVGVFDAPPVLHMHITARPNANASPLTRLGGHVGERNVVLSLFCLSYSWVII